MESPNLMIYDTVLPDNRNSSSSKLSNAKYIGVVDSWYFSIPYVIVMILILVLSTFGGLFVCFVINKHKMIKNRVWFYLFMLAVSDSAGAIFSIPIIVAASFDNKILAIRWICNFNGFSMMFFGTFSIMTLAAISVRKYVTISRPLKTRASNPNKELVAYFAVVLIVPLFFAASPLLGFSRYTYWKQRKWCVMISSNPRNDKIMSYILSIFGYFIPMCAVVSSCVRIHQFVKLQSRKRAGMKRSSRVSVKHDEDRISTTLLVVVAMFFILWTPLLILLILGMARVHLPACYSHLAYTLLFLQGCVNPIIYCYRHKAFKKEFQKLFKIKCTTKKEYKEAEFLRSRKSSGLRQIIAMGLHTPPSNKNKYDLR